MTLSLEPTLPMNSSIVVSVILALAPDTKAPVLYPGDGQKDVQPMFPGNEVPDPIPDSKTKLAGNPITATFPARTKIRNASGKLLDAAGKEVPAWFSSPERPANAAFRAHQGTSLCLIAQAPLAYGAAYKVEMEAEVDGRRWSKSWSFTTMSRAKENEGMAKSVLDQVNATRTAAGLKELALDTALSQACQAHAEYVARNIGDNPELDVNDEDAKLPGHTAEGKRIARHAQVSAAPFDPMWMVEGWFASFHYRFPLTDRSARKIAFGCARGPRDWHAVLLIADPVEASRDVFIFPADGQKDVPLDYESGEKPDPIPESKDRRAGYPISVHFPADVRVRGATVELRKGKEQVPGWLSTPEKPVAEDYQHNTVCLIAKEPLEADTEYAVRASARFEGKVWEKTWTFRTRDMRKKDLAEAEQVLARVNLHRKLTGLPPVVFDEDMSRGCRLHARYLVMNLKHPSTQGLGMHDEDPKLPGYSRLGKQAGENAVIAAGMPPTSSVEDWMATFYHRIPLLDPEMKKIGFGQARGGPSGWITVLHPVEDRKKP